MSEGVKRCCFILKKKNRSCRMLVKPGNLFCGEHAIHSSDNLERIVCPNDGKHTVLKSELEKHLTRCNARIILDPWITEGLNAIEGETKSYAKIDRRPTSEELHKLIEKLCKSHEGVCSQIEDKQFATKEVEDYISEAPTMSEHSKKHLLQISSIIGHLKSAEFLTNNPTASVFELGAGKAQLAYWMAKVAPSEHFLLVDRSGARNKHDNKALQENPSLNMKRLRCSIEHLDLSQLDTLRASSSLCAVCKHFCGSATDAGIRCLVNGLNRGLPLNGFVLVPCCHHKSRFIEYSGKDFLDEFDMNNEVDFSALRHVASWATCGMDAVKEPTDKNEAVDNSLQLNDEIPAKRIRLGSQEMLTSSVECRIALGRIAKALLELGRAKYLRSLGFDTKVVKYVPTSISPENLLIIGVRK